MVEAERNFKSIDKLKEYLKELYLTEQQLVIAEVAIKSEGEVDATRKSELTRQKDEAESNIKSLDIAIEELKKFVQSISFSELVKIAGEIEENQKRQQSLVDLINAELEKVVENANETESVDEEVDRLLKEQNLSDAIKPVISILVTKNRETQSKIDEKEKQIEEQASLVASLEKRITALEEKQGAVQTEVVELADVAPESSNDVSTEQEQQEETVAADKAENSTELGILDRQKWQDLLNSLYINKSESIDDSVEKLDKSQRKTMLVILKAAQKVGVISQFDFGSNTNYLDEVSVTDVDNLLSKKGDAGSQTLRMWLHSHATEIKRLIFIKDLTKADDKKADVVVDAIDKVVVPEKIVVETPILKANKEKLATLVFELGNLDSLKPDGRHEALLTVALNNFSSLDSVNITKKDSAVLKKWLTAIIVETRSNSQGKQKQAKAILDTLEITIA
jgi:hypothetical protein